MSYNLMSGSVEFIGDTLGQVEDIVNVHTAQTISGAKTFNNITASGGNPVGLTVVGQLSIDQDIIHAGDNDTKLNFPGANEVRLYAGNQNFLQVKDTTGVDINKAADDTGHFTWWAKSTFNSKQFYLDADLGTVSIGGATPLDDSVKVHISGSAGAAEDPIPALLAVGDRKHPVLAVSGNVYGRGASDWKIEMSGVLKTNRPILLEGPSANLVSAGPISASIVQASQLSGALNNLDSQSLYYMNAGSPGAEKYLAVKLDADEGLTKTASGLALDIHSIATVGSINTSTSGQDFIAISDNDDSNSIKKMGVGSLLALTMDPSVNNLGSGGQVAKTVTTRVPQFRSIVGGTGITVATNTNDLTINAAVAGAGGDHGMVTYNYTGSTTGAAWLRYDPTPNDPTSIWASGNPAKSHVPEAVNGTFQVGDSGFLTAFTGSVHVTGAAALGDNTVLFDVSSNTVPSIFFVSASSNAGYVGIGGDGLHVPAHTLSVKGNVNVTSFVSASGFSGDGSNLANVPITPAGPANALQLNQSGSIGGSGDLLLKRTETPAQSEMSLIGNLTCTSFVSASGFAGDGSNITGLPASVAGPHNSIQVNRSGSLHGDPMFKAIAATAPGGGDEVRLFLTGTLTATEVSSSGGFKAGGFGGNNASYDLYNLGGAKIADLRLWDGAALTLYDSGNARAQLAIGMESDGQLQLKTQGGQTYFHASEMDTIISGSAIRLQGAVHVNSSIKTANYILDVEDRVVIFNSPHGLTASLPKITAENVGVVYTIKNINTGAVKITGSGDPPLGPQNIDGNEYVTIPQTSGMGKYRTVTAVDTGADYDWIIIGEN